MEMMEMIEMVDMVGEPVIELWGVLGALLGTLALLAGTLWAGRQVPAQARALWLALRGHRAAVVAAVDEPLDPLVTALAQASHLPAGAWAVFLPAFLNGLADGLDRAMGGAPPDAPPDQPDHAG